MKKNGIRIISLEASEIYKQIKNNGEELGYVLPDKKDFAYFRLFKNVLDYSLDAIELEKAYKKICRKAFTFIDKHENEYTLSVINLKFDRGYLDLTEWQDIYRLREYFYEKGFNLGGVHYVRYKRSSGSSRQGKCLFIDERVYKHMSNWGECGLKPAEDISSWEAYKSLSLSSLKGTIKIPFNGILFIPDYKSSFEEDIISVEEVNGKLVSEKKRTTIINDIWDGESLLDESLFVDKYIDKHMLLLRNKFFKSCGFKTKLQEWFKDKNIAIDDLKARGFITFATDINQIVMVTTPNSMKFLKFMKGDLTENNVRKWMENISDDFGVVKYDKRTKFFDGEMVQTSYQFINTLGINQEQAQKMLQPSLEYISLIREDCDFMHHYFSYACKREADGEKDEISDGLAERSDVIFRLMKLNYAFKDTRLYANFRNEVVEDQKNKLKAGHILLSGTNATLFGNGPEMLYALSGEFDMENNKNQSKVLLAGEVACRRFLQGAKLVCARSPHITMGNLYCATNNLNHDIWNYFDLGENIVCVNAIGENIQQRLNGCDYDSDTMLITDDELVVTTANEQKDRFYVPVCNIVPTLNENQALAELDYATSNNQIGEIVNLSQKLNSLLWDNIKKGLPLEEIEQFYNDICILAVLSGIEIDKAKRAYQNVKASSELWKISNKYPSNRPKFFEVFDNKEIERLVRFVNDKKLSKTENKKRREEKRLELQSKRVYETYETAMQYVYQIAEEIDFRKGKPKQKRYLQISDIIKEPTGNKTSTSYAQKEKIVNLCQEYGKELSSLYKQLSLVDNDEKEVFYQKIQDKKAERNEKVSKFLTNEYVLYLVLKHYEKKKSENWHLYAPILECELFVKMLKQSKEKMLNVVEDINGEFSLYSQKYTKK